LKHYILLLIVFIGLAGCSEKPTPVQLEVVDRLIQEQIDIPYQEPNFSAAKELLLKNGETVKQATERHKQLYADIHDFLVALKNKPYQDKKAWAINNLESSIDLWERTLKSMETPLDMSDKGNKEVILLFEQRKKWLAILKK